MGKAILKYIVIILILSAGFSSDYYTKKWADKNLNGQHFVFVKNFIDLGLTKNRGMVFGFLNSKSTGFYNSALVGFRVILLITLTVILFIFRKRSLWFMLPFIIIWIGAAGNIVDVFTYGYVIDFIHIHAGSLLDWPFYFNLADAYISTGAFLLFVREIRKIKFKQMQING